MSRLIDLEVKTRTIWISFPYDATVVAAVKTLPDRRFERDSKRWSVPMRHAAVVVETLQQLHFRLTPRMRDWWTDQDDRDEKEAPKHPVRAVDPSDGYTISRLNDEARTALRAAFGDEVWVVAEVDGLDDRNTDSGHAYFELVERLPNGGDPIAKVGAVLFASNRRRIARKLGEIQLRDGLLVRLKGKVEIYPAHGRFQFVVEDVDAEWSAGAMRRNRERILAALEEKGVLRDNVDRQLPLCPLRVGLITSIDSDAYNDFVHELERSGFGFRITAHHANVQGRNTEKSVLRALHWFDSRSDSFDVVAIVRGGGSRSDLSYFDTMAIGECVCGLSLKVVAGVGHHRDRCVLDFVAHSEKTPTAAAQLLVSQATKFSERVERAATRARERAERQTERAWRRLERTASTWQRRVSERLHSARLRFTGVVQSLNTASDHALRRRATRLATIGRRLERGSLDAAADAQSRVELAARELEIERMQRHLARLESRVEQAEVSLHRATSERMRREGLRLEHLEAKLRLSDPRRILERGFAIVRDPDQGIVTQASRLKTLEAAQIQLRDGKVSVVPTTEDQDDD